LGSGANYHLVQMLLGKITWIHYQLISLGANYPMTVHSCTGLQICIVPTKADKKHQSIKVITCGMTIAKFRIPIARPAGLNRKKKLRNAIMMIIHTQSGNTLAKAQIFNTTSSHCIWYTVCDLQTRK
jgi:hypothetical protein